MTRVIFSLALLLSSLPAFAQSPELVALGMKEFDLGKTEFNLGHYEKALEHFEASYRLTGKPALLYNIAYVHRQLWARTRQIDHLKRAVDRYDSFLSSTRVDSDPRVTSLRPKAEREIRELSDELARERAATAQGEQALALGEELLTDGKLDEAEAQLDRFDRAPGNERPGVARAHRLRGLLLAGRGQRAEAIDALLRSLSLDKSLELPPGASLEARGAFAEAQSRLAGKAALEVTHAPPGSLKPAAPVELSFQVASDPARLITGLQLHYRAGAGAFSTLPVKPVGRLGLPGTFSVALQPGQKVEYYAEVLDANAAILQHLGTTALPFSVLVETQKGPPVTRRWWFWTVTVGVVAAAAVGVGLGVGLNRSEAPVQIPVNGIGRLLHY